MESCLNLSRIVKLEVFRVVAVFSIESEKVLLLKKLLLLVELVQDSNSFPEQLKELALFLWLQEKQYLQLLKVN